MNEAKPFASLSSGLLARKGGAKPAMRPQGFGQMGMGPEDLGWNDMGHGPSVPGGEQPEFEPLPEHVPSSIAALTPAPRPVEAPAAERTEDSQPELEAPLPAVVEQQRAVAAAFAAPAEPERPAKASRSTAASVVPLAPRERGQRGAKGRSAFTLRLDPERHLKLRLACAVTHRSAQQLVSNALDEFLRSLPELEAMANQVPAKLGKRS